MNCDCGKPGQWHGDRAGHRVFCCEECFSLFNQNPCSVCNTRHSDGSTCQIETLERCLSDSEYVIKTLREQRSLDISKQTKHIDDIRLSLVCWYSFGRAVAKELGCLVSYADPRPEHGNAHILRAIQKLKANAELAELFGSLSEDELKTILEKRGINTAQFLNRCHEIIERAKQG